MPFVKLRNGGRLHYDTLDLTDPWIAPEVTLLHHGLGKSSRYWLPWSRLLALHYRVVAFDMLGNGRSSQPRRHPWSIEGYAANAIELLDDLGIDRIHFVGEGLGGCVGLHLGARHGDRIASLTLSATPFRPSEGTAALASRSRAIADGGLERFVDETLPDRMDWSRHPQAMYDWYRAERLSSSPRIMAEQMAAQADVDLEWTLPLISAPTLLLVPGASPSRADKQMLTMAERISRARLVEFPRERQWLTFSAAEECVAAFHSFQKDLRAKQAS